MGMEQSALSQIATTLARHFDSLYYVEIETGRYLEIVPLEMFDGLKVPKEGKDFFAMATTIAKKYVHPEDLPGILRMYDKDVILEHLNRERSYSGICRMISGGKIWHIRHIDVISEDQKHILFCLECVEEEFRQREEQKRNLQSAERMARRDELTGIKNKNAFVEYSQDMDRRIGEGWEDLSFGVVMCDINDLKLINDTRGHSFGDETIQRASRMICNVFKHSPVFRIGGDEFVAVLTGGDLEQREHLVQKLQEESAANGRTRSGPVVACGLAVYDRGTDVGFDAVFKRADRLMYENKNDIKSRSLVDGYRNMEVVYKPIPDERKRLLDGLFGALYTVAAGSYIYLNDMRYDYSRWSLPLVDDFGLESEYMYHADKIWQNYIHPDDEEAYKEAVEAVISGNNQFRLFLYRARMADGTYAVLSTRGFVLTDSNGEPEYFGGIMIRH
ncbi:MAG: diguanylate cyclase [Lachnospiraceae bacterium]|nr:diguanylate cyclase [Lachnospiraceae bacterium]